MNRLYDAMLAHRDETQVEGLSRFFKTKKGEYGEGDVFLGIKVPVTRSVVKELWKTTSMRDLEECVQSPYHEVRLAALLTLVQIFKHAKKDVDMQQACVDFYLSHLQWVNNWDLVDLSCYEILGPWLLDRDRTPLYELAGQGQTLWEQRVAIVSTMAFVRKGQLDDTYAIAELLLERRAPLHDLLQKATGWLLRETGKRDEGRLVTWLRERQNTLPRTLFRYAIEKLTVVDWK